MKKHGGLYHAYINVSQKYHLWAGIKPLSAFKSRFRLILVVKKLLTSEGDIAEVANRRKVKKIKGQIFRLLVTATEVWLELWS